MDAWDLVVDRDDLSRTELRAADILVASRLDEGEVLLEIERFSLTANNITYGVVGDRLGYWRFFPVAGCWGRIPVWGFATVVASRAAGVAPGLRLYGYWPMSTHLVTRLAPASLGYADVSPHRSALPSAYNRYEAAVPDARDDYLALLRPLFTTSFLLDDYLAEIAPGATVVLSSASSRTALGLAWLLARRSVQGIAVTSAGNARFVAEVGLYRSVWRYDEIAKLELEGGSAYVDLAGDAAIRASIHHALGDRLLASIVVGSTHRYASDAQQGRLEGPAPSFFFAPDRIVARGRQWGGAVLAQRISEALNAFIEDSGWLSIRMSCGPNELLDTYQRILAGIGSPSEGDIVRPGGDHLG